MGSRLLDLKNAPKLETILVCVDGMCGRCRTCEWITATKRMLSESMATEMALIAKIQGLNALCTIQREAIRTLAATIDGNDALRLGLSHLVETTPEQALAALQPEAPTDQALVSQSPTMEGVTQ